jgi:hypothetical protein
MKAQALHVNPATGKVKPSSGEDAALGFTCR